MTEMSSKLYRDKKLKQNDQGPIENCQKQAELGEITKEAYKLEAKSKVAKASPASRDGYSVDRDDKEALKEGGGGVWNDAVAVWAAQ